MIKSECEVGFGNHCYGVRLSSPSSNLSAFAPPFSFGRSTPCPNSGRLIDLNDPPDYSCAIPMSSSQGNPQNTHLADPGFSFYTDLPMAFGPQASSNSYEKKLEFPPLNPPGNSKEAYLYGQRLDGRKSDYVEANPYYPTYASAVVHGDDHSVGSQPPGCVVLPSSHVAPVKGSFLDDFTPKFTGMENMGDSDTNIWKFRDWERSDTMGSLSGFYSNANTAVGSTTQSNYINEGTDAAECLSTYIGDLDDRGFSGRSPTYMPCPVADGAFVGESPTYMPGPYFHKPISRSTSLNLDADQYLRPATNAWELQMPPSTSYWKSPAQPSLGLNGNESFGSIVRGPYFDAPTSLSKSPREHVTVARDASCVGISANDASNVTSPYPLLSSDGIVHFDASHHGRQPQKNDNIFREYSSLCNEELSGLKNVSNNALGYRFDGVSGVQDPCGDLGGLSVGYNFNGAVRPAEDVSGNSDFSNPAIDSPCWKGTPSTHFSPSKACDVVPPVRTQEVEVCSSLNLQQPDVSLLGTECTTDGSLYRASQDSGCHEYMHLETVVASTPKRSTTTVLPAIQAASHEAKKSNLYPLVKNSDCGARSPNFNKQGEEYCISNGSSSDSVNSLANMCHTISDSKRTCEKVHTERDVGLKNTDVDAIPGKLDPKDSTSPVNTGLLVKEIYNLSELLLFRCSSHTCELEEDDYNILNYVIQNLNGCLPKNGKEAAMESDSSHDWQAPSERKVELPELQGDENTLEDQIFKTEENKNSDSASLMRDHTGKFQVDDMTQAIKKVLDDNFHGEEMHPQSLLYKNLWLEAEAALCSITYKARFNRMKADMEKCQLQNTKDVLEAFPNLALKDMVQTEKRVGDSCSNHSDKILTRLDILKRRGCLSDADDSLDVEVSSFKVSDDTDGADKTTLETKSCPALNISNNNPSILSTSCYSDDVMARFHILKSRGDHLDSPSMDQNSSYGILSDANVGDILAHDRKRLANPYSSQNSVLQNFIASSGDQKLEIKESYFKDTSPAQSRKEFHCSGFRSLNDQISGSWCDDSSLEWEHVAPEELRGQTA